MKKMILIFIVFMSGALSAQSFTLKSQDLSKKDSLNSEIVFDVTVKNNGSSDLTLAVIRTKNELVSNWSSSLCFTSCFAPFIDTIKTTQDFGSNPISPGDSIKVSLHVFTSADPGTGKVNLLFKNLNNNSDTASLAFEAQAEVNTDIQTFEDQIPSSYFISQNYPNPFNPTTKIQFGLHKEGDVKIEIFNVLGEKVKVLLDKYMSPGTYTADFNATNLSSGVYLYKMKINNFVEIKKMILEK